VQEADLLRAAFRDVHGSGLHGFAVLVTAGDRSRAAALAAAALAQGTFRVAALRHPERAAAWLRCRVLRAAHRSGESRRHSRPERHAALRELGVPEPAIAALEGLSIEDRTAIVASSVERFSMVDVAAILGRDLQATRRVVRSARRRYLTAALHWLADEPEDALPGGEIAARVDEVAQRTIGPHAGVGAGA
jgi:DNA-directed RNA polymerase specialized sigma24 family protein